MENNIYNQASRLRRQAGEKSLLAFSRLYLTEHIAIQPSDSHLEIYKLLSEMTSDRGKKLAIAAPRDFGKSTMITLAYIIYLICYSKEKFIVIISNTADQARKILNNVRKELTENEALSQDFPEIFENEGKPRPPRWTKEDIITRNGIELTALGYNQQIRGRKHGCHRPTLVIMDDLEDGENTFSYETKENMKRWLNMSVLKVGSDKTNYLFIGTVHNSFSLLNEYLSTEVDPSWFGRKYKAIIEWPKNMNLWEQCWKIRNSIEAYNGQKGIPAAQKYYKDNKSAMDEGAVTIWPQKWALYRLMEMHVENDISFASEMQNEPRDTDKSSFNVDNFNYWSPDYPTGDALLRDLGDRVSFYGACDPALDGEDYSAIIIVAKHNDDYYIIVADIAHKASDELIRDILAYAKRYKFTEFVVEANGFQKLLVDNLEKEAMSQGLNINLTLVKNSSLKKARILSIYPLVKNGSIKFCKSDKLLLDQFKVFPKGKHDDGLDALEMVMRICYGQAEGSGGIYTTDRKDIYFKHWDGWDPADREFLDPDGDDDGPSPNAREIGFF